VLVVGGGGGAWGRGVRWGVGSGVRGGVGWGGPGGCGVGGAPVVGVFSGGRGGVGGGGVGGGGGGGGLVGVLGGVGCLGGGVGGGGRGVWVGGRGGWGGGGVWGGGGGGVFGGGGGWGFVVCGGGGWFVGGGVGWGWCGGGGLWRGGGGFSPFGGLRLFYPHGIRNLARLPFPSGFSIVDLASALEACRPSVCALFSCGLAGRVRIFRLRNRGGRLFDLIPSKDPALSFPSLFELRHFGLYAPFFFSLMFWSEFNHKRLSVPFFSFLICLPYHFLFFDPSGDVHRFSAATLPSKIVFLQNQMLQGSPSPPAVLKSGDYPASWFPFPDPLLANMAGWPSLAGLRFFSRSLLESLALLFYDPGTFLLILV